MQPRLLMATNNRFWLGSIGSNARIAALVAHLRRQGWDVVVVFMGRAYPSDAAGLAALDCEVVFSRGGHGGNGDAAEGTAGAAAPLATTPALPVHARLRAAFRSAVLWLRALATQPARPLPPGGWRGLWREVLLRSQEPRVRDFVDHAAVAVIERLAAERPPRVVLVQYLLYGWLAPALRRRLPPGTAWVLDAHDVMHERQTRFHALGQVHGVDISAREEAQCLSQFDAVLAIQQQDACSLRSIGVQSRVLTVMHPFPAAAVPRQGAGPVVVGFLGSAMAPNTLALQELLHTIWPAVRRAVGDRACLVVAGGVCDGVAAADWPAEGVRRMGFVAELDDFYAAVDIVASPLRIGGGLKIKNVEALCKGKALVTTPIGAEGLDDGRGSAFLVIDAPQDIAAALVSLVDDAAARQALGSAALALAQAAFSEQAVYREFDAWLAALPAPAS
jgi:glycosyltransferase involved in cell wall biosynthesis